MEFVTHPTEGTGISSHLPTLLQFRVQGAGFRVQGSGWRVQDSELRVQSSGFRVQGSGFRVQDSGFRVQDSGFRVQGAGCRVPSETFLIGPLHAPQGKRAPRVGSISIAIFARE